MLSLLLDGLKGSRRYCLLIGIGGGGDIVGCLPTMMYLERLGIRTILGSLTWERIEIDRKPGPRRIEEFVNVVRINRTVALLGPETRTIDGIIPQAAKLAGVLGRGAIFVDINDGVRGVVEGLEDLASRFNIGLVIGIDVGGDVLATGEEPGLQSPLADSMMLAALASLSIPAVIGVFGIGCDGELTVDRALNRIESVARMGGYLGAIGMGHAEFELMKKVLKKVETEASRLPVMAFAGDLGFKIIRGGRRYTRVTILSTLTYFLSSKILYKMSPLAQRLSHTCSLAEAIEALHELGIKTEYDYELEALSELEEA